MHSLPLRTEIEPAYRILELDPDSPSNLVESSWRKLVDEWRPDRFVDDSVLYSRALARVETLNRAHALLKAHLASIPTSVGKDRSGEFAWTRLSVRRPLMASTMFAGLALAAVLIARPLSNLKNKPVQTTDSRATQAAIASQPTPLAQSEIRLVPRAALTVSASLVADGRILLPETTLSAGQITSVPRLGPTYIKYSAGENLEIEFEGRRYAMPDSGPNRAKIN